MGTKNERNTSGVYRAEALRLIQSRRIWILCGILWLYLMIQGTEIYREVGADREIIRGFWQQTVIQILRGAGCISKWHYACCVMYGRFSKPIL